MMLLLLELCYRATEAAAVLLLKITTNFNDSVSLPSLLSRAEVVSAYIFRGRLGMRSFVL